MIDWKIGDDEWDEPADERETSADEAPESAPTEEPTQRSKRRRRVALVLSLLVTLVGASAAAIKWRSSQNVAAVKAEVQSVIDQEMWALESGNWDLYQSLLDRQASPRWFRRQHGHFVQRSRRGAFSAEITDLALVQPDLALVEARIDAPDGQAYREAQAYRQVGNTWRHTAPPAGNFWVHQVVRETANLRVIYHRDDADRLEPLIPELQRLYTQLLNDFHLTPLPNRRELQVVLSVRPADFAAGGESVRYDLTSLAATSDVDLIQRELGRQLAGRVMQQFYDDAGDLAFVLVGVQDWEVSDWMDATDPAAEARIRRLLRDRAFIPLSAMKPLAPPAHLDKPTANALGETVVDYLVWRNGRGAVRTLIREISQFDHWPALIETGLGITYQDLDLGWWQFVIQRYASSEDRSAHQVLADLVWMLALEEHALETRDRELFHSLLDPRAPSQWETEQLRRFFRGQGDESVPDELSLDIQDWNYEDDLAWLTPADASPALRIYRFDNHRWYLTSPSDAFDDPPLTATTEHFEFRYRDPDADLIEFVTPAVDALYEQVTRDFGLGDEAPDPMTVELLYSLDSSQYAGGQAGQIALPSPRLFRSSTATAQEEFQLQLGYSVVSTLLVEVVNLPARRLHDSLLYGLVMWEVEQWGDVPKWQAGKIETIQRGLDGGAWPPLAGNPSVIDPDAITMRYFANITIAEYVAETFGRHRFADIVKATNEYQDLRELIPAALDVDAETFEAGWRAYLERNYGN